ncbi:hypothetical protein Sru01_49400 [Sphaerisporangium rufum]|uniref:CAAX prenyl protease 2/Lysostaphin resistance protein A-like domain-containing protein n=2 Tax=Sphaerisporangium rufum TaxID=1381558 RepID=A0A919R6D5_9ACTN|nr:hypothetical protein Sru01_49400 [Sphaerisporangium rufum]
MIVQTAAGPLLVMLLAGGRDGPLIRILAALSVTLVSVPLVYAVRRFLHRQSWSGVGLTWSWAAVPQALAGLAAGVAAVALPAALAVALGVTSWAEWPQRGGALLSNLPVVLAAIVLAQAFPEELVWRGHLYDTLSGRLSTAAVVATVSVGFGALHIISQSPADTLAERLLYVLMATALGFACAMARLRGGAVWMAVGVHTGLHIGLRLAATADTHYGVQLLLMTAGLTLAGVLIGRPFRRSGTGPEPVPAARPEPATGEGR